MTFEKEFLPKYYHAVWQTYPKVTSIESHLVAKTMPLISYMILQRRYGALVIMLQDSILAGWSQSLSVGLEEAASQIVNCLWRGHMAGSYENEGVFQQPQEVYSNNQSESDCRILPSLHDNLGKPGQRTHLSCCVWLLIHRSCEIIDCVLF